MDNGDATGASMGLRFGVMTGVVSARGSLKLKASRPGTSSHEANGS